MTDPAAATPGWVDKQLDAVFARLPAETRFAREAFAACLARSKNPATPSDLLGAEFEPCHAALRRDLLSAGVERSLVAAALGQLEALEAEIAAES